MSENDSLEILADFVDALESACVSVKMQIKALKLPEPTEKPKVNLDLLKWQAASGPRGPYEKAFEPENADYVKLYEMITQHGGHMAIDNFFLWTMNQGGGIGKKQKQRRF